MRDPKLDSGSGGSSSGGSSSSDSNRRDWSQPTDVISGSAENTGSGGGGEDRSGFDAWRQTETEQRQDLDSHNERMTYTGPDTGVVSSNAPEQDGSPYQGGYREDDGGNTDPNGGTRTGWKDPDGKQGSSDTPTDGLIGNDGTGGDDRDNPDKDFGLGEGRAGSSTGNDAVDSVVNNTYDTAGDAASGNINIPSADDLLPDWLPWAAGGVVGLLALMVFSYTVGQLFDINLG